MKQITFLLLFIVSIQINARQYYVSTNGADTNKGTFENPFLSITKAISIMNPGDICFVREGTYHEEIALNEIEGSKENPISICAYKNEKVVLDGSIPIQTKWERFEGDIFRTKIDFPIWHLFVNEKSMTSARWPNAPLTPPKSR